MQIALIIFISTFSISQLAASGRMVDSRLGKNNFYLLQSAQTACGTPSQLSNGSHGLFLQGLKI